MSVRQRGFCNGTDWNEAGDVGRMRRRNQADTTITSVETSGLSYRDQRFSCVLGMFSCLEVRVLYPT